MEAEKDERVGLLALFLRGHLTGARPPDDDGRRSWEALPDSTQERWTSIATWVLSMVDRLTAEQLAAQAGEHERMMRESETAGEGKTKPMQWVVEKPEGVR